MHCTNIGPGDPTIPATTNHPMLYATWLMTVVHWAVGEWWPTVLSYFARLWDVELVSRSTPKSVIHCCKASKDCAHFSCTIGAWHLTMWSLSSTVVWHCGQVLEVLLPPYHVLAMGKVSWHHPGSPLSPCLGYPPALPRWESSNWLTQKWYQSFCPWPSNML